MTNQEINFDLALAIGYTADRVRMTSIVWQDFYVQVLNDYSRGDGPLEYGGWQRFDHTDPAVIWPIAERFDAFPVCYGVDNWSVVNSIDHFVNSPATASALAVIKYAESQK